MRNVIVPNHCLHNITFDDVIACTALIRHYLCTILTGSLVPRPPCQVSESSSVGSAVSLGMRLLLGLEYYIK